MQKRESVSPVVLRCRSLGLTVQHSRELESNEAAEKQRERDRDRRGEKVGRRQKKVVNRDEELSPIWVVI